MAKVQAQAQVPERIKVALELHNENGSFLPHRCVFSGEMTCEGDKFYSGTMKVIGAVGKTSQAEYLLTGKIDLEEKLVELVLTCGFAGTMVVPL